MRSSTGSTTYQMRQMPAPRVMKPRRARNRRQPPCRANATSGPFPTLHEAGLAAASRGAALSLGVGSRSPDATHPGGARDWLARSRRPASATGRRRRRRLQPRRSESRRAVHAAAGAGPADARALRLPARARRHPRLRGRGGAPLPRRAGVGDRRLPRRRHVLRAERLPDHLAARHRMGRTRTHRPAGVLAAPGPASAALRSAS